MPGQRDVPLQGLPRRDDRAARLLHPGLRRHIRRKRRDRAPGGMTLVGEASPSLQPRLARAPLATTSRYAGVTIPNAKTYQATFRIKFGSRQNCILKLIRDFTTNTLIAAIKMGRMRKNLGHFLCSICTAILCVSEIIITIHSARFALCLDIYFVCYSSLLWVRIY